MINLDDKKKQIIKERVIPALIMAVVLIFALFILRFSFYWTLEWESKGALFWILKGISIAIIFVLSFWIFYELAHAFLQHKILSLMQTLFLLLTIGLGTPFFNNTFLLTTNNTNISFLYSVIFSDYIYIILLFANTAVFFVLRVILIWKQINWAALLRNTFYFIVCAFILSSTIRSFVFLNTVQSGLSYILLFIIVSVAHDIGGFFGGMKLGHKYFKNKLAPLISPKKTYEGAIIGLLASILASLLFVLVYYGATRSWFITTDFISKLIANSSNTILMILFLVLSPLFALVGDLFFSLTKRILDIKDFSNILKGHGGILDRIDSISFVFVLFIILSLGIN
ncbi:phosphatidate cytidylyltransferase [Mycoplasmopsis edwardii]|uniref:Phosphatidate cytidylyltransferase n=1 Tax=Mycoplasmopsis edwardii TaxID=53558 RepID=A0ACD4PIW7_9BACT|nr:phosphatidate cytidylyltransferase [Mycoplasmopsis edwardii]WBP84048.1 phosphatidate cytidylyltransferase [Mycoplasmopsis edwardii]